MSLGARGNGEPAPSADRTGQRVGERYLLREELGRGSTSTVWDAADLTTGERVAVKILHDDLLPSPAARSRFHREIAHARALDHRHSVRVLGEGLTADGAEYLVMERVAGRPLAAALADGPLPQARAIEITAQILDATAEAHRLGIVHRDLKPGNVMLVTREDGADFVKVCDYGLAKQLELRELETGAAPRAPTFATVRGVPCGTPAYMSPEQARGDEVDARTDLYAIGVMLYRMVVGRLPFEGRTPGAALDATLTETPPAPRAVRPDLEIAPALEGLILRAMAKDRRERPSSAEVLRADLLQVGRDLARDARARERESRAARERESRAARSGDTVPALELLPRPPPRKAARRAVLGPAALLGLGALGMLAVVAVRAASSPSPRSAASAPSPRTTGVATEMDETDLGLRSPAEPPAAPSLKRSPTAAPTDAAPRLLGRRRPSAGLLRPPPPEARAMTPGSAPSGSAAAPAGAAAPTLEPDVAGMLRRGEEALARGEVEAARTLGLSAVEVEPARAQAWELLGRCTMRLGHPEDAREYYQRALALAPNGPRAAFLRAIVGPGSAARAAEARPPARPSP
jgi:serine/threonine protein kinase